MKNKKAPQQKHPSLRAHGTTGYFYWAGKWKAAASKKYLKISMLH